MREHPLIRIHLLEEIIKSSQAPTPTTDTFHDILDAKNQLSDIFFTSTTCRN